MAIEHTDNKANYAFTFDFTWYDDPDVVDLVHKSRTVHIIAGVGGVWSVSGAADPASAWLPVAEKLQERSVSP